MLGMAAYIAQATFGGKNFKEFLGIEEANQGAGVIKNAALRDDNFDAYWEMRSIEDETLDRIDESGGLMPLKNVADGVTNYVNTTRRTAAVMDDVVRDRQEAIANGLDFVGQALALAEKKDAMYRESQDYNFQLQQQLITLREDSRRRGDRASARLWAKHAEEQRELEAADREAIRLYWIQYWEMKLQMQDENRPSKLNFGIV